MTATGVPAQHAHSVHGPGPNPAQPEFWQLPAEARAAAFARLRELDHPVRCTDPRTGKGFHALVRHADVVRASRNPALFLSGPGVTTPEPPRWVRMVFGDSMVNLDDPHHAGLRRIVARAFTPRLIARAEADIRRTAAQLVDEVVAQRPTDFVAAVAAQLPYRVICDLMGVPEAPRRAILAEIDRATAPTGVRRTRLRVPGRGLAALARLYLTIAAIGRERRRRPTEDLISALVTADVEGHRLGARELGAFFSLLLVAGVETTRNALAHGLHLLTVHPEQRALLTADLGGRLPGAVEEIVRYATPIVQFRRTVAADCEFGGAQLRRGEKVVLFFGSANRDAAVFADPDRFDLTRSPNPHLGFGGGGPHFCLGAHLARQEMRAVLGELYTRLPELRSTGEPELVASSFDHRVRSLPFTF
ncbi:cytochrome P450 [Kitasatospora sp. MMS16-BH015]|uniref:cytochrome P450 n=1 Tax=Kitasatospora sp. MMS16-BH015 TaxID=2018025 RepID=UPI000CA2EA81|nr:cytochrome P450 [Kitasatospora sp. MMS16-BH015]AUG80743.1 cytochrome P450 [Kitasatospora sp. MMS16-BH015]